MIIKLDYRETDLEYAFTTLINKNPSYNSIKIFKENLPIGDVIICDNDLKEIVMIERKTLNDLASSICDGRYAEQSFRLQECSLNNHNIYYLIEGNLTYYKPNMYYKQRISKKTILSAMTSLSFSKGFSLLKTNDVTESAEFILQMTDKLYRIILEQNKLNKHTLTQNQEAEQVQAEQNQGAEQLQTQEPINTIITDEVKYSDVANRTKKNNVTPDNILNILLSQIPSVSNVSATAISTKYKTMEILIEALRENKDCLKEIKYESKPGKFRSLTKPARENIYNYLMGFTLRD